MAALLHRSEVLLRRIVGPDVELMLPSSARGLNVVTEAGDVLRILVALLSQLEFSRYLSCSPHRGPP